MDNWDDVPADIASKLRQLRAVYNAYKGYANAGAQNATVAWTQQHPDAWDLVTRIMQYRKVHG